MASDTDEAIDALLARYVAGVLPAPARMLVQCHLELKGQNHRLTFGMEALAGAALETAAPIAMSGAADRVDRIVSGPPPAMPVGLPDAGGLFPSVLRDFVGGGVDDVPWRTKMPGFKEHEVGEIDGCHVTLFWIRPGRRIPAHTHEGTELTLVLDGAFTDRNGRYGRGDIALADDTVDHRPIAETERPCIGLAVTDGALRLTGPLHQRLSDILGV